MDEAPSDERVRALIASTLEDIKACITAGLAEDHSGIDNETFAMVTELLLSTILGLGICELTLKCHF